MQKESARQEITMISESGRHNGNLSATPDKKPEKIWPKAESHPTCGHFNVTTLINVSAMFSLEKNEFYIYIILAQQSSAVSL